MNVFSDIYRGRRVLVTGHTGFKGSWLCLWLQALGAQVSGLALDPDAADAHFHQLNLQFAHDARVNLRERSAVAAAITAAAPEIVFHLAAQPLVREGYRDPLTNFEVNLSGLVHVFEAIRAQPGVRALVVVTTDKVYADPPPATGYREDDRLGAHDPYSTSKACAELISECYRRCYFESQGIGLATARAGNVIGGGDWAADRLLPDFARALRTLGSLMVRNPRSTRPWQHVLEPLSGYLLLGERLLRGDFSAARAWNFGPCIADAWEVAAVLARCQQRFPSVAIELQEHPGPPEAAALTLDSTLAMQALQWAPVWNTADAIDRTLDWYSAYLTETRCISHNQLEAFVAQARAQGLAWAS